MSANNTVHIATESYGGPYGPIFASYIQSQNTLIANKTPGLDTAKAINLKSLIIGNGFYDFQTQYPAYYNFTVFPGNTSDVSPYNAILQAKLFNNVYGKGGCI
jgi:carboxypeptidase C (cathepsin A)